MPLVSTLGGPGSTAGNSAAPENIAPIPSDSVTQAVLLHVQVTNQFDGSVTDLTDTCVGITMAHGFDITISTCTIELTENPNVSNYSRVEVYCSAGTLTTDPHNFNGIPLRFVGVYLRTEASLWPHTYSMVCRGPLYFAQQYKIPPAITPGTNFALPPTVLQNIPTGILLFTDTGDPNPKVGSLLSGPDTDQAAIVAILNLVSQVAADAGFPGGFDFDPGLIGGTGSIFGMFAPLNFVWSPFRSALDVIQGFDQICLGYRMYETYAGRPIRTQIYAYPYGPADTALTEGVDIWEGSNGVRSVEQLFNYEYVEGATLTSNESTSKIISYLAAASNDFQPSTLPVVDQFSSSWIESSDVVAPDSGALRVDDVANWRLNERNRELVTGQWVTYRDDLFLPGHVININVPHTATTENVWMQRIEVRMTADPVSWTQTIYGVGGGRPGTDNPYTPPNIVY